MIWLARKVEALETVYKPLAAEGCGRDSPTVLIVSADRAARSALERGLRERGFFAWVAANGEEAVALYRSLQGQVDVVLSDARLPGMDGPEVLDALRAISPTAECCFVTDDSHIASLTQLFIRGARYVFVRPLSVALVAAKLLLLTRPGLGGDSKPLVPAVASGE